MEEELAAGLGERQIAEFVEYDEVEPGQVIGETALPAGASLAFEPIDEINDGIEAAASATTDTGSRDGYGEMRLASAGSADQHGVALFGKEAAARQIADQ